jgi:hypothetical protein
LTFKFHIFNKQKETNNQDSNAFLHFFFHFKNERKTQDEECLFPKKRNLTVAFENVGVSKFEFLIFMTGGGWVGCCKTIKLSLEN